MPLEIALVLKPKLMTCVWNVEYLAKILKTRVQERLSKKMILEVWFLRVPRFFSLPYLVRSISIQLNDYAAFLTEFYGQCLVLPDSFPPR